MTVQGVLPAQWGGGVWNRRKLEGGAAHQFGLVRHPGVYGWAAGVTGIPTIICKTLQYVPFVLGGESMIFIDSQRRPSPPATLSPV